MDELLADFRAGVDIYLSVHRDASDAEVAVKQVLYEYTRWKKMAIPETEI